MALIRKMRLIDQESKTLKCPECPGDFLKKPLFQAEWNLAKVFRNYCIWLANAQALHVKAYGMMFINKHEFLSLILDQEP